MLGDGGLAGRVYVDLDEFKRQHQNAGFMDPLNYVSGRVPVTARGILSTSNGRGQFKLGSAEILGVPLDRKSTRLNSSHSQNSYAVFCLKKKKNNNRLTSVE